MAPQTVYPSAFLNNINSTSKPLNMTLELSGVDQIYGLASTYEEVTYGMPGVSYGDEGLVYGGLVAVPNSKPYISDKSTLTISQKLEPEQGRASISSMSIILIDKNGEITDLVSPGGDIVSEILGRDCTIRIGFVNTNWPSDYYVAFRGIVTNVVSQSGQITLTLGDANQKRRTALFQVEKTNLTSAIDAVTTTIPGNSFEAFYAPILGPDSTYDSAISLFMKIDDEIMQYVTPGVTTTTVTRAALGTIAAIHDIGAEIVHSIQIQDHPLTIALKLMLSGWNGPYLSNVTCIAIGTTIDTPSVPNAILLNNGKDANLDYGLTVGDWVTISGSTAGNDGTYQITEIEDAQGFVNNVLRLDTNLTLENPASTVLLAFRSKYDTLPVNAGLKLSPIDVDVLGHENLRDNYLNSGVYTMRHYVNSQQVGKDFIEQQLYLPIACYSLTRYGRLSVNQTRPPIATETIQFLNLGNIINPESITITRGLNTRKFWNSIQYQYDQNIDGSYASVLRSIDTDSLNNIGIVSLLPINGNGMRSDLGAATLVQRASTNLLSRYKNAAYEINLKVIFTVGSQIEVGDIVALQDNGYLHLSNFDTGQRNLGTTLFEVTNKSLDIKTGVVSLTLTSGVTGNASDRYGTISPSSLVTTGSSSTQVKIISSYSATTHDESTKWVDYIGLPVTVRNDDYSIIDTAVLQSVDNIGSPVTLTLVTPLSFTPTAGMIVDVPNYPTSTLVSDNQLYKIIHAFLDPLIPLTGGVNNYSFTVGAGDISKILVGSVLYLRDQTFTTISSDLVVTEVDTGTNTVTVKTDIGFIPTSSFYAELVGFADGGAGYRIF